MATLNCYLKIDVPKLTVNFQTYKQANMDEKLQNLLKTKQLQDEVITLRSEMPAIYEKYLKRSQSVQLKRLLKVQIEIPVTEISIPDQSIVPIANQTIQPKFRTELIENDCQELQKIFDFIK